MVLSVFCILVLFPVFFDKFHFKSSQFCFLQCFFHFFNTKNLCFLSKNFPVGAFLMHLGSLGTKISTVTECFLKRQLSLLFEKSMWASPEATLSPVWGASSTALQGAVLPSIFSSMVRIVSARKPLADSSAAAKSTPWDTAGFLESSIRGKRLTGGNFLCDPRSRETNALKMSQTHVVLLRASFSTCFPVFCDEMVTFFLVTA